MSSPQSADPESNNGGDPPALDKKENNNGDAATDSTSVGESPPAASSPASPPKPSGPKPYEYDPKKITLKFVFANRDGSHVILECTPQDTVGEVKGALLSVWPEDLRECSGGDKIRLICMGKGILAPDTRTLEGCSVPVFKTHATPINVAVKPEDGDLYSGKKGSPKKSTPGTSGGGGNSSDGAGGAGRPEPGSSGCSCIIM